MKKLNFMFNKLWLWIIVVFIVNISLKAYDTAISNDNLKDEMITSKSSSLLVSGKYTPEEIGKFNKSYIGKIKSGKEISINIKGVEYEEKGIVITVNQPNKETLSKDFEENIDFHLLDKNGKELPVEQVDFIKGKNSKFIIRGQNLNKAGWLRMNPYENINHKPLIYHIDSIY